MKAAFSRGRITALLLIFAMAIAMWVALSAFDSERAEAHFNGYDSVNSSEYMSYRSTSIMRTSVASAAASWDVLNCRWSTSCNGVDLDAVTSGQLINVYDENRRANYTGYYSTSGTPDKIVLNRYYLDSAPSWEKTQTAAHEFGHALGFNHAPSSYRSSTIMTSCSSCANKSPRPLSHDLSDYYSLWIN